MTTYCVALAKKLANSLITNPICDPFCENLPKRSDTFPPDLL